MNLYHMVLDPNSPRGYSWTLDWCFGRTDGLSPTSAPYSYDPHFLWRDFDKDDQPSDITCEYSDRMREWNDKAYADAMQSVENPYLPSLNRVACREIVKQYYGGKRECVGYAICANKSNGAHIGIFFTREVK
jgi:hypothetical protein